MISDHKQLSNCQKRKKLLKSSAFFKVELNAKTVQNNTLNKAKPPQKNANW